MKKFLILLLSLILENVYADNVYIISYYGFISEAGFFGDPVNLPFRKLKENFKELGHNCIIAQNLNELKNADHIVFFNVQPHIFQHVIRSYPQKNRILYIWEPVIIDPSGFDKSYHKSFSRVLTWDDDLVDKKKYHKFFYTCDMDIIVDTIPFEKRKFCTLISSNKASNHHKELYSSRKATIDFFEKFFPNDFEFGGKSWPKNQYKTYLGDIGDKVEHLKNYKFSICYENMKNIKGYITEKIFDCLVAGCIPVYWGADNIADFIPSNCFIDRREFKTNSELYNFLKSINKDEFDKYIENIRIFFKSEMFYKFSMNNFTEILLDACNLK